MSQSIFTTNQVQKYVRELFSWRGDIQWATRIVKAILEADSPRISDVARAMAGSSHAAERAIYRFLEWGQDPREAMHLLYREEAEYLLADLTEMPRPQAKKTDYVGYLADGETRGYDLLMLSYPYRGRALPFSFVSYSSATIAEEATSRNQERARAWGQVAEWLEGTPLLLDRDFSSEEDLEAMQFFGIPAVIRLHVGGQPDITLEKGDFRHKVRYDLQPGEKRLYRGVWYKGKIRVAVIGVWEPGFREPLWVMSFLPDPEEALRLYRSRMKIEQQFRDFKSLLHLEKLMNKSRDHLEKMVALCCIAYTIGVLVGEKLRDRVHRGSEKKMEALLGTVPPAEGAGAPQP